MLIGIVGFAGSGKGTVGKVLARNHKFVADSFAGPVKDAVSVIFGWDRELLEGDIPVSRLFRERPDKFWSKALDDKKFTPRKAMQLLGTEGGRHVFGDSIWISSLVKRWQDAGKPDTIITDCRFMNEVDAIRELGGKVIRIQRGPEPSWYQTILFHNKGFSDDDEVEQIKQLRVLGNIPHESETDWIGCQIDELFKNEDTVEDLEKRIGEYIGGTYQLSLGV